MKKIILFIFLLTILGCFGFNKNNAMQKRFYSQIKGLQVNEVRKLLEQGADPNKCTGEFGWIDNNPILNIPTYLTLWREEIEIQDPSPDIEILKLLLNAGADINARPYIWFEIYANDNDNIIKIKELKKYHGELNENPIYKQDVETFIEDVNRFLKALLEAGADVDKLGHSYPFSNKAISEHIDDLQSNKYFENGTRPINEAIKKGILWESQVDLLLQYTNLDENSLLAAKESGDTAMIEKINKLWELQQDSIGARNAN
jgi:hypothetical protein